MKPQTILGSGMKPAKKMKNPVRQSEQRFFAGLCHMGFEIYTDYLLEKHQDYLNSAHGSMLH